MPKSPTAAHPTMLDDVVELATARAPFTSVYLPVDRATEDSDHRTELVWRHLRHHMSDAGSPDHLLDQVGELVLGQKHGATVAVVIDGDGQVLVRSLPEPLPEPVGVHGPLPHLVPLIGSAQANPPYVVAMVDRAGADIVSVVDGVRMVADEAVEGDPSAPITKVAAGGWSQRRFQQRAENTWATNAAAVAEEVAQAAQAIDAAVIVAAGDEHALSLLQQHLAPAVAPLLRVADTGGRAIDGSADELQREVERAVATSAASKTAESLRRFVELRGRRATVADGPGATFAALREGQAAEVLVHASFDDVRTAWFDPVSPSLVAGEARTLRDLGVEPVEAAMVDVIVWAALRTGATVQLIPGAGPNVPSQGVGAFLRGPLAEQS